jgi:hypothetical protein
LLTGKNLAIMTVGNDDILITGSVQSVVMKPSGVALR